MVGEASVRKIWVIPILIGATAFLGLRVFSSSGTAQASQSESIERNTKAIVGAIEDRLLPIIDVVPPLVRVESAEATLVEGFQRIPPRDLVAVYSSILVTIPGPSYGMTRQHSHYNVPIKPRSDGLNGNSRRWGDASLEVQAVMIDAVVKRLSQVGYSRRQIGFVLALLRYESGFNPDAAAGYTSAAGLVQMIDKTRNVLASRACVNASDPFDPAMNIECLVQTLREMFQFAAKRATPESSRYYEFAYAYHHDGPSLSNGGRAKAVAEVLPWIERCESTLP